MPVKANSRRRGNLEKHKRMSGTKPPGKRARQHSPVPRTIAAKFLNTFQPSRHIRNGVSTIALFIYEAPPSDLTDTKGFDSFFQHTVPRRQDR